MEEDTESRIRELEEFFSLRSSPEKFLEKDPNLAKRAIILLDRIREISGEEYVFVYLNEGPSFYCAPFPKSEEYNPNVTRVLGIYDRGYFEKFLIEQRIE